MIKNRYQFIKKIIDYCEEYETEFNSYSVSTFAEWLMEKNKPPVRLKSKPIEPMGFDSTLPVYKSHSKNLDRKHKFLDLISRLARFHDFYLRKFLEDLPVHTRMEYLFLYTIHYTGSIRKTDIIQLHLVDFSTGMDIIKRLLKQGFITEKTDDSDKRTKLITLTEQGGNALQKTMKKADQERMMFFSAIDENKWKKILPVLEEIHDFHNDVYHRYHNKNEAELRNLIASLRYFYK